MVEVRIPDPTRQHEKTPAWRRVKGLDEYGSPYYAIEQFTIGTGQAAQVLRWHELALRVKNFIETRTVAECRALFRELTGDDYVGLSTAKSILRAILQFYLGFTGDDTTANLLQRFADDVRHEGRWGLGCPYGCGRFWEFKPDIDMASLVPTDTAAIFSLDEAGNPTNGYLNWNQGDFRCDRCGDEIRLVKA